MILPETISCASRTITISDSMREVGQFAKKFKFKVALNQQYCFKKWFLVHPELYSKRLFCLQMRF